MALTKSAAQLATARTGSPWRDLPAALGAWNREYVCFARWSDKQVWKNVFAVLRAARVKEVFLDSTVVRARQHGAGAAKKGPQALGRSRAG